MEYNGQMDWRVVLEKDPKTGDWAVWCPELPGCVSAGTSQEEAESNMREAIGLYLQPAPLHLGSGTVVKLIEVR